MLFFFFDSFVWNISNCKWNICKAIISQSNTQKKDHSESSSSPKKTCHVKIKNARHPNVICLFQKNELSTKEDDDADDDVALFRWRLTQGKDDFKNDLILILSKSNTHAKVIMHRRVFSTDFRFEHSLWLNLERHKSFDFLPRSRFSSLPFSSHHLQQKKTFLQHFRFTNPSYGCRLT